DVSIRPASARAAVRYETNTARELANNAHELLPWGEQVQAPFCNETRQVFSRRALFSLSRAACGTHGREHGEIANAAALFGAQHAHPLHVCVLCVEQLSRCIGLMSDRRVLREVHRARCASATLVSKRNGRCSSVLESRRDRRAQVRKRRRLSVE